MPPVTVVLLGRERRSGRVRSHAANRSTARVPQRVGALSSTITRLAVPSPSFQRTSTRSPMPISSQLPFPSILVFSLRVNVTMLARRSFTASDSGVAVTTLPTNSRLCADALSASQNDASSAHNTSTDLERATTAVKRESPVPEVGLEPTRPCDRGLLRALRMPIPPLRQACDSR